MIRYFSSKQKVVLDTSMITIMVVKNIVIFLLGILFSTICHSLISAYHLFKSVQTKLIDNVQFIEDKDTGKHYWNEFDNYKSALDAWYISLARRFTGSSKSVAYYNSQRARLLFIASPITLLIVLILVMWLMLRIQVI